MKLGVLKLAGATALAAAIVLTVGAAGANGEVTLRGFGTAEIDGVLNVNEWEGAGRFPFQVDTGGETVPATFYVMNDSTNLYLAVRVAVASMGNSRLDAIFLAPPPAVFPEGNDVLKVTPGTFEDLYFHPVFPPSIWDYAPDTADGGTRDGASAARAAGGEVVFEVAHPLDSTDDRHDFSLTIPSHIGFIGAFGYCLGSCAGSLFPSSSGSQIVIVSGTRVPPDTTVTFGPANGAEVTNYGQFGFVGTDDVAPPSELTYECKIDTRDWTGCQSPLGPVSTEDGWHTVWVRALDEMLNVDPTPERRRFRIDTQNPSKPTVVVSRRLRKTELRLSATDRGTPARRLRFRCAVDGWRFHACAARYRVRLPSGRHVLHVYAIDPAGNGSTTTVRFVVR